MSTEDMGREESAYRNDAFQNEDDKIDRNGISSNGSINSMRFQIEMMLKRMQDMQDAQDEMAAREDQFMSERDNERDSKKDSPRRKKTVKSSIIGSVVLNDVSMVNDAVESHKYPTDCYTLIGLNTPRNWKWSRKKLLLFLYGLTVFIFQIGFVILMIMSRVLPSSSDVESDNPNESYLNFIPANSQVTIRISQVLALLTYTMFPDATLMDVFRAYQYWPKSKSKDDHIVGMKLACTLRGIQGYLATVAVFLVVITTPSVVDIILNFTALNFVSSLDDEGWALAKSGVWGDTLRVETERIEELELPACMTPKSSLGLYWKVMGSTAVVLFFCLFALLGCQLSSRLWITQTFRVEFKEETLLKEYSGCYELSPRRVDNRFSYTAMNNTDISFGYCREERKWILYEGEDKNLNPCNVEQEDQLAFSTETNFFDIAKSFEEIWFYPSTTNPIDMFFFPADGELYCDRILGDGVCDKPLNELGYLYDYGDCCAPTCTHPSCGKGGYDTIFNNSNISANGYPHCVDPNLESITIHLDSIVSSRDPQYTTDQSTACSLDRERGDAEWRAEPHVEPVLYMKCDGIFILTLHIKETMKNQSETVKIQDGASCTLYMENTTRVIDYAGFGTLLDYSYYCDDPIWLVNYTIFHDEKNSSDLEEILILNQDSVEQSKELFRSIPRCYFTKLKDHVDESSIYTGSDPINKAIAWLLEDDMDCGDDRFIERFALSAMIHSLNGNITDLMNREEQCEWPWLQCTDLGQVTHIILNEKLLKGPLPKEIELLTKLEGLYLYDNEITSIPSEMGKLTILRKFWAHGNKISSIPSEIGLMENLDALWLYTNQIEFVPTEIGLLTGLVDLELGENKLTFVPSEIGLLKKLEAFWIQRNQLASIPSEIGLLQNLSVFDGSRNKLVSLPSEIGLLTNIVSYDLQRNNFNLTTIPHDIASWTNLETLHYGNNYLRDIPSELWKLTDLQQLLLPTNEITSIPTEIGLMKSMKFLWFSRNQLTSIPSEIGMMANLTKFWMTSNTINVIPSEILMLTNLKEFLMGTNQIALIPSEIGMLTNLNRFSMASNTITVIPSEIGMLTNLEEFSMGTNQIALIPSEIGMLTNLNRFSMEENQIALIPSEIGMLTNLKRFSMEENQIALIPSEIGMLTNLKEFSMASNTINVIPSEILMLTNLEECFMGTNQIAVIPSDIGYLTNLFDLRFDENQLASLPSQIGLLQKLTVFVIAQNYITYIPSEIGLLENLAYVNMSNNQIKSIPSEMGLLTNLVYLNLGNNNISSIPHEVKELCSSDVECIIDHTAFPTKAPTEAPFFNVAALDLAALQNIPAQVP